MSKNDNFLEDAVHPKKTKIMTHMTYTDGFRFGFGMFIGFLFGTIIVGGLVLVFSSLLHIG